MLPSHHCIDAQSDLLTKILCAFLLSPMNATYLTTTHLNLPQAYSNYILWGNKNYEASHYVTSSIFLSLISQV
jgi:hypothetical protein